MNNKGAFVPPLSSEVFVPVTVIPSARRLLWDVRWWKASRVQASGRSTGLGNQKGKGCFWITLLEHTEQPLATGYKPGFLSELAREIQQVCT